MKEPGVGWREEYDILLRKAKSQGQQHIQQLIKKRKIGTKRTKLSKLSRTGRHGK